MKVSQRMILIDVNIVVVGRCVDEDSLEIIQILSVNVLHSLTVSRFLLCLVLQNCMTENSHPHVHRLYLCQYLYQRFFNLYHRRVVSHRTRMLCCFGLHSLKITWICSNFSDITL